MENGTEHIALVRKARKGDKASMDLLAKAVYARLLQYVVRLTLNEDLAQDIVQETIVEMYRVFKKLKNADKFWSWIYRIAFNKVRSHYSREWRHKTVSLSDMNAPITKPDAAEGLAEMVSSEWKQIVVDSISQLQPRHRAILIMRCYDEMSYSEIADCMQSSEISVRALFYRAKKSLAKRLSGYGLDKGAVIAALIFFGKYTATSEAAAATVAVTSTSLHVGFWGALVGIVASKSAIVTMAVVSALTVGSVVVGPSVTGWLGGGASSPVVSDYIAAFDETRANNDTFWYYYPPGFNGTVLMQSESDTDDGFGYYQWFQNEQANFYEDGSKLNVENYRMWNPDLSVKLLPTDSKALKRFIQSVQGGSEEMDYVPYEENGLMVIVKNRIGVGLRQIVERRDVSNEEFFRCNLPSGIKRVDNRDIMHKRGWANFKVEGSIGGELVRGKGRIAFVYSACKANYPWLRLRVGSKRIVEAESFAGLSRPWMGLHSIDTVRRDAAKEQIWFDTKLLPGGDEAVVTLDHPHGKIEYTIDMNADLVEKISFLNSESDHIGELRFTYLQENDSLESFAPPAKKSLKWLNYNQQSMLWLAELLE